MSFKTTLLQRPQFTTEALEQAAADLRSKGKITVRDPENGKHDATVINAEVTERGLEVELQLDTPASTAMKDAFSTLYGGKPVSMGCKIAYPPSCSICDDDHVGSGIPELDNALKDGLPVGEIGKFHGKE